MLHDTRELANELGEIAELLHRVKPVEAEHRFRELLSSLDRSVLLETESHLTEAIGKFTKKRKKSLAQALRYRLEGREGEVRVAKERGQVKWELGFLRDNHIFDWANHYRATVREIFNRALTAPTEDLRGETLSMLREELVQHGKEIFEKGYGHQVSHIRSSTDDAVMKGINGLRRFMELPVEVYLACLRTASESFSAESVRGICGSMLGGILEGFGESTFGRKEGWSLLPKLPRGWAHFLPFLTIHSLQRIAARLERGTFRDGIIESVAPLIDSLDKAIEQSSDKLFLLPEMGQFALDSKRLEVFLVVPGRPSAKRFVEAHSYLDPTLISRQLLEESLNRGAILVAGPLRADLKEWAEHTEPLRRVLIDTAALGGDSAERAQDILGDAVSDLVGGYVPAGPITFNFARVFPLEKPHEVKSYYHVPRMSVRRLIGGTVRQTGVKLWCSVRRSGKTTACFDLGSVSGTVVVSQTCGDTKQYEGGGAFYEGVVDALSVGRQLPSDFFRDCVTKSSSLPISDDAQLIFVLDEYETLFEHLFSAARRDSELRYAVAQPLLNQMAGFSEENLIVLVGQRPDAHYILMDQNQLSPYVKQAGFPLFEHEEGKTGTEFTDFVTKVISQQFQCAPAFTNAVYKETAGHPWLTANVLTEFFDFLIENGWSRSMTTLTGNDFDTFTKARLTPESIRKVKTYELFRAAIAEALSEYGREQMPWLHAVYSLLGESVRRNPKQLSCSYSEILDIFTQMELDSCGHDIDSILMTAEMSNFLKNEGGRVSPKIPVLGRICAVTRPRLIP